METLAAGGLMVILLGWVLQFLYVYRGEKKLSKDFLAIYALGALILAYDGYGSGVLSLALLNLGCLLLAVGTLWKLK